MNKQEAQEVLGKIWEEYRLLPYPKYRHADFNDLKEKLKILKELKPYLKGDFFYINLLNSISQTLARLTGKTKWLNVSERGINKAIPPLVRRKHQEIEFPFRWVEEKYGQECFINNGYWSAKNYLVMDVVGYFFLLSLGGDLLPDKADPLFKDLASIKQREMELNSAEVVSQQNKIAESAILSSKRRFAVTFTDKDFRRFVGQDLSSKDILELLLSTSRVEFKLVFPVRLPVEKEKSKEYFYVMQFFSHPFEVGYRNIDEREDGVVRQREYMVVFNTLLGELFVHNLLSKNYDWVDTGFYRLPQAAQVFYRRFLIHNNYSPVPIKLETIAQRMNYADKNITNLTRTVEESIFKPLLDFGLISSYAKESGLGGIKYVIKREKLSWKKELSKDLIESRGCKT